MKQKQVNRAGDPFRHIVTHAPANLPQGKTFGARYSMKLHRGKVTFAWRIFNVSNGPRKAKKP